MILEYFFVLFTRPWCPVDACLQMIMPPFTALLASSNIWNQTFRECTPVFCAEAHDEVAKTCIFFWWPELTRGIVPRDYQGISISSKFIRVLTFFGDWFDDSFLNLESWTTQGKVGERGVVDSPLDSPLDSMLVVVRARTTPWKFDS